MQAFQGHAHLKQLKCLEILEHTLDGISKCVVQLFSDWLLWRTPGLRALNLAVRSWEFAGGNVRFEHLQHLQLGAGCLHSGQLQAGMQLPLLQTLCITGGGVHKLAKIDVADCHQLRQLALKDVIVETLHRQPSCQLDLDLGCVNIDLHALLMGPMGAHMGTAGSIHLLADAGDRVPDSAQGLLGTLPALQTLNVSLFQSKPSSEAHAAQSLLMSLMPGIGPVCNLKVIIIGGQHGVDMKCTVPAGLPHLEELVIWMNDSLKLSFEDPCMSSKALKEFCAYAGSLDIDEKDMQQMAKHFGTVGLALSAVVAPADGTEHDFTEYCTFLKPAGAADPPLEEIFTIARQLAYACRCGACFECLRTAGCVDSSDSVFMHCPFRCHIGAE